MNSEDETPPFDGPYVTDVVAKNVVAQAEAIPAPPDNRSLYERFPDQMVDTESTGLNFERNAIIQITAVRFNLAERTISHDFFDRCLWKPDNRFWDESTREWWLKKKDVLMGILARGEDPKTVLEDLTKWAGPNAVMWAKPTHFDHTFLKSYYSDFNLPHPYFYRSATDMNSFLKGRYFPNPAPQWEWELPFDGPKHNAIFDCLHQIKTLFKAMDDTETKSIRLSSTPVDPVVVEG